MTTSRVERNPTELLRRERRVAVHIGQLRVGVACALILWRSCGVRAALLAGLRRLTEIDLSVSEAAGRETHRAWLYRWLDPDHRSLDATIRRFGAWGRATRRRRWALRGLLAFVVLIVVPIVIGAVATAQTDTGEQVSSVSSGLSWMGVHDSQGVQLSKYSFVTNTGGVMHLGNTIMSTPLLLLYAGWYVIQTSAIWFIGWVLSFAWLNWLGSILREVAVNLTAQIATSLMLVTAGTIGAFFVAYFVTRGFYAKAAMQVVSMLAVAIFGALFLADPLGDVL